MTDVGEIFFIHCRDAGSSAVDQVEGELVAQFMNGFFRQACIGEHAFLLGDKVEVLFDTVGGECFDKFGSHLLNSVSHFGDFDFPLCPEFFIV